MITPRPKRALTPNRLESLEDRLALSTMTSIPVHEAVVSAKGGRDLGAIYGQYVNYQHAGGHGAFAPVSAQPIAIKGNTVRVDVHVKGDFKSDVKQLQRLGMKVTATSPSNGIVEGYVPIAKLPNVASARFDVGIKPIYRPFANTLSPASSPNPSDSIIANKGGQALASIYQEYLNFEQSGGTGTFNPPEASQIKIQGTSVGVDIRVTGDLQTSVSLFKGLGMHVTATAVAGQVGIIEGFLPIGQLPTVASDAYVVGMAPMYKATPYSGGRVV